MYHILQDNAGQQKENDDDYRDTVEKLAAVYGEEWKNISLENRMDNKYFKDIPEFLQSKRKILTCESVSLILKYIYINTNIKPKAVYKI